MAMIGNIKSNNVRGWDLTTVSDKYYDFMLYRGEAKSRSFGDSCIIADIDAQNAQSDGKIVSLASWEKAKSSDFSIKNIGLTGMDNGQILFRKDNISNSEFLGLLTGSTKDFTTKDLYFTMQPVSGNTMQYSYPFSIEDTKEDGQFYSFKGGFLQGFYKLEGYDYQVLPNAIESDWFIQFRIRRRNYETPNNILNATHPENKGIFFYMGTRAENKFLETYNNGLNVSDDPCYVSSYSNDGYFGDTNYLGKDSILYDNTDLTTNNGFKLDENGQYELTTDNKHIFFNHTDTGFTTDTWNEGDEIILTGKTRPNVNIFPLMNHTDTDYTTDTIEDYLETDAKQKYDAYKDIKNNAFALKINDDGSIGYRYCAKDCNEACGVSFVEEKSKPNLIPLDEWVTIGVRLHILNGVYDECNDIASNRLMKIYIYVNGFLVFISKSLPELHFRGLNDIKEKQETVPYNLSLGGGTQGLADGIWLDFRKINETKYPLENNFAGSFIGDIQWMKFSNCF